MRRFYCGCGQEIYFDNLFCGACGSQLGFEPDSQTLLSLEQDGDLWRSSAPSSEQSYRFCEHRSLFLQCNWLIPAQSPDNQCLSCAMTRTVPILDNPDNLRRWRTLESAKRRMFYGLLVLGLPLRPKIDTALIFDFLEDKRSNPGVALEHVLSGHAGGVITLNAAEADDSYREATKEAMNEPYRTLLGHFRHEIGHFYWDFLIKDTEQYQAFCALFGDDSLDYRRSLDDYYANGPRDHWQSSFISAYASAHPLEDWAETWAHYLLMMETLETALSYGLIEKLEQDQRFENWLQEWLQLVVVMNALNRSTGHSDAYPFVVSDEVQHKLKFIHDLVSKLHS